MGQELRDALTVLRALASGEEFETAARLPGAPGKAFIANTHVHLPPNFSAFAGVTQAVEMAQNEGLHVLGAGNYYDFGVYGEFAAGCLKAGIFPLFGVEVIAYVDELAQRGVKVNDPGNPGKMYLCGKGISRFDGLSGAAAQLIAKIRQNDRARMRKMITLLDDIFHKNGLPVDLDEAGLIAAVAARSGAPTSAVTLQERHVALAFQEALFERLSGAERAGRLGGILRTKPADATSAVSVQNDIRTHLMKAGRPAYVEEKFVSFEEACALILELGGIPCYPVLADGASPICPFEQSVDDLIASVRERNIPCVEFIPARNDAAVLERYVTTMRRAGLVVTAGTEHNTLDMLPLTPRCRSGRALPAEVERIFREGACVAAAHQALCLGGKNGFVDSTGALSTAFGGRDELIKAMAQIGALLVERAAAKRGG